MKTAYYFSTHPLKAYMCDSFCPLFTSFQTDARGEPCKNFFEVLPKKHCPTLPAGQSKPPVPTPVLIARWTGDSPSRTHRWRQAHWGWPWDLEWLTVCKRTLILDRSDGLELKFVPFQGLQQSTCSIGNTKHFHTGPPAHLQHVNGCLNYRCM